MLFFNTCGFSVFTPRGLIHLVFILMSSKRFGSNFLIGKVVPWSRGGVARGEISGNPSGPGH